MSTITGVSLTTPRFPAATTSGTAASIGEMRSPSRISFQASSWMRTGVIRVGELRMTSARAAPEKISEKVAESVKQAEEVCAGDPTSGECVAAWDEVEELSAAASHARDRKKESDVLEEFCKDNPADEECRTYED